MTIFLDANVLFSATLPKSRMREFVVFLHRTHRLVTSAYALEEAKRNLAIKAPAALPEFDQVVKLIDVTTAIAEPLPVELAAKDIPILGGAIASHATYLMTGDERDFGKFYGKVIAGVTVVSPRMLAEKLMRTGELKRTGRDAG